MCVSIFSSGISFSGGLVSLPLVASCDNASAAWCLLSAPRAALNSCSDNRRRYGASQFIIFTKVMIHSSVSWSVRIVNRWLSKYDRTERRAHAIARHTRWVVAYCILASVSQWENCLFGLVVSCSCFWSKTEPMWALHMAEWMVSFPLEWFSARICWYFNALLKVFMAWNLPLLSVVIDTGWSFLCAE